MKAVTHGEARSIRVLAVIPTFWPRQGGAQMVLAAIASGLGPRVDCEVLTRGYDDSPSVEESPDFRIYRYANPAPENWKDYATGSQRVSFPAKVCVALCDVVGSMAPLRRLAVNADLVHVHFPLPLGLSAVAMRMLTHRPLLITVHGNADVYELPQTLAPLTRAVLNRADAVVSVSRDLAEHMSQRLGTRNVIVIPNGVNTDLYQPSRREPSDSLTLLSVSRIVPRKNIDVLIAAVDALARSGDRRLKLVIAGSGPDETQIERLAKDSAGDVRFVGFVDEARKRELYAEADLFVQLSTREGLSIATLEALASGLPCLVSDLIGVREPVTPGKTGFLVGNPESVPDVIAALRRVLDARAELPAMRLAARQVAEELYSHRAMAEGYWNVYQHLLHRG